MYISRLVKTRDPHPGLLQFAIILCLFSSSLPSSIPFHLYCLHLTIIILYLYLKIVHLCYLVIVLRSLFTF
jgi:hypothetical protein